MLSNSLTLLRDAEGPATPGAGVLGISRTDGGLFQLDTFEFKNSFVTSIGQIAVAGYSNGVLLSTEYFRSDFFTRTTGALNGVSLDQVRFTLNTAGGGFVQKVQQIDNITLNAVGATVAVTPEPSSPALLGTGVLGVVGIARRRFAS